MSDDAFQYNGKTPGDSLLNLRAATAEQFAEQLDALTALAPKIAAAEAVLKGNSAAGGLAAPPQQQPYNPPPQAAPQAPPPPAADPWAAAAPAPQAGPPPGAPAGAACHHPGVWSYKEGVNKSGRPYKGWFCPQQRSDCKPVWVG